MVSRKTLALITIGLAMLVMQGVVLWAQALDEYNWSVRFILIEGVLFAAAAWLVVFGKAQLLLPLILGIAAFLRVIVVFSEPYHSSDIYRYVWDGRVQASGINPYSYIPNDPKLVSLRDEAIWSHVNRADYAPTIYPPAAQAIFLVLSRFSESVLAFKLAFTLFDAVTIAVLLRLLRLEGLPDERILLYSWCPLPIWEFACAGHIDAAMTMFVVLALWAFRQRRNGFAGAVLGLAVLVKFLPLVLFPAFWRRWQWKLPLAAGATILVGYLPYLGAGRNVFGFLCGYVGEEGIEDGGGFWLLRLARQATHLAIPSVAYIALVGLVLAAMALMISRSPTDTPPKFYANAGALALVAMIGLSPAHPWYLTWLVPFLCLVPNMALLWLSSASFILYGVINGEQPWLGEAVYGIAIIAVCVGLVIRFRAPILERTPR